MPETLHLGTICRNPGAGTKAPQVADAQRFRAEIALSGSPKPRAHNKAPLRVATLGFFRGQKTKAGGAAKPGNSDAEASKIGRPTRRSSDRR